MSYLLDSKEKKHLLWCVYDDDDDENFHISSFKICEFRVCDCFFDWTIYYQNKNKDGIFSEEDMTDFFVGIPTDVVTVTYFHCLVKLPLSAVEMHCFIFSIRKIFSTINFLMSVWHLILICSVCIC